MHRRQLRTFMGLEYSILLPGWVDKSQISGFFNTEDEDAPLQQAG